MYVRATDSKLLKLIKKINKRFKKDAVD